MEGGRREKSKSTQCGKGAMPSLAELCRLRKSGRRGGEEGSRTQANRWVMSDYPQRTRCS